MKKLMVGALQLPTLGTNATRLEFYLKKAKERGAKLILLGEYVTNHFFKELPEFPIDMVKKQTQDHLDALKRLSKEFDITIIAPIIEVKNDKLYKKVVKISPKSTAYANQQILIDYEHWNEEEYFANEIEPLKEPLTFTIDGFKISVIFGFEIHFDYFWQYVLDKKIDLVLLPTASTFGSKDRWSSLIKMRAFLNNCYILRANRVGEYSEDDIKWHFYGDTMMVNPNGGIEMRLEDRESMLIEPIYKEEIKEAKESWRWAHHISRRKKIKKKSTKNG